MDEITTTIHRGLKYSTLWIDHNSTRSVYSTLNGRVWFKRLIEVRKLKKRIRRKDPIVKVYKVKR